jgi:hypothetical protein
LPDWRDSASGPARQSSVASAIRACFIAQG